MTKIIKTSNLALLNDTYVVEKGTENIVYNANWYALQNQAAYIVAVAAAAKGKDFVGKKADDFVTILAQVTNQRREASVKEYVSKPIFVQSSSSLTEQLKAEALAFISFDKETSKVDRINKYMQQFNALKNAEVVGLAFENGGPMELSKIYTIDEITVAVTDIIDQLA